MLCVGDESSFTSPYHLWTRPAAERKNCWMDRSHGLNVDRCSQEFSPECGTCIQDNSVEGVEVDHDTEWYPDVAQLSPGL